MYLPTISDGSAPLVLIVDDEALNRDFASGVLTAAGWRVAVAGSGEEALIRLADRPDLVLMDLRMDGLSGPETVAAIRAGANPASTVPILAFTSTRVADVDKLIADGFDGLLSKPCTPAELVAAAAHWRPDGAAAVLDRLADSFGATQIDAMAMRFRELLGEAVAALDRNDDAGLAHRVAGIAGTLGFADVGTAWLALSEGDEHARTAARAAARRAIAVLDRRPNARPS